LVTALHCVRGANIAVWQHLFSRFYFSEFFDFDEGGAGKTSQSKRSRFSVKTWYGDSQRHT